MEIASYPMEENEKKKRKKNVLHIKVSEVSVWTNKI